MAATTAQQLHQLFESHFAAGNLDGVMDLYEDNAVLLTLNGPVQGKPAIREQVQALMSMGLPIQLETRLVTIGEGLALMSAQWKIEGVGAGHTAEVARLSAGGQWRLAIHLPWGL
jgi:ketosteroid isomerase-like protein